MADSAPPANELQQEAEPDTAWEHRQLYDRVKKTLFALPSFYKTELNLSGILATDLFNFNAPLGATIETQVVTALNELRGSWDPEQKYALYQFVRQSQRFPDVVFRLADDRTAPPLLGIELKGWYILAKEKEPSFRYKVSPTACAPADLLVVYPWALSNVISGSPQLFQPYVVSARYAAEYRNYWWQHIKSGGPKNQIELSKVDHYYPTKSELISDVALNDNGNNFGRFARTGLMDSYIKTLFAEELSGIPMYAWQRFLAIFAEERPEDLINQALDKLNLEVNNRREGRNKAKLATFQAKLAELIALLSEQD